MCLVTSRCLLLTVRSDPLAPLCCDLWSLRYFGWAQLLAVV